MILLTIAIIWSCFPQKNTIFDYKKIFAKLHRWIWAFCSHVDLSIVHLHFLHGMILQFSTDPVNMHFFMFYMRIRVYFGVWFMSIGVKFVLGTERTLKRNLLKFICIVTGNRWKSYKRKILAWHQHFTHSSYRVLLHELIVIIRCCKCLPHEMHTFWCRK